MKTQSVRPQAVGRCCGALTLRKNRWRGHKGGRRQAGVHDRQTVANNNRSVWISPFKCTVTFQQNESVVRRWTEVLL